MRKISALIPTLVVGLTLAAMNAQAALTADPDAVTTGIESVFDAAALLGLAILGVTLGVRFAKKGLRLG